MRPFHGIFIFSTFTLLFHYVPESKEDILLATIFAGMALEGGVSIVIRYGRALDGTGILAVLINKKAPFSASEIVLFFNIFISGTTGFVFRRDRAMYSIPAYVTASKTINTVVAGLEKSKSSWIISDQFEEIGEVIADRHGRGATFLQGEGAYTGGGKKVTFCVITRLEEAKLKGLVDELDPMAFLAAGDITEVRGRRFKKRDIYEYVAPLDFQKQKKSSCHFGSC